MRYAICLCIALVTLVAAVSKADPDRPFPTIVLRCELPSKPTRLNDKTLVWTIPDSFIWSSSQTSKSRAYRSFAKWASRQPNLERPEEKILALRDAYLRRGLLSPEIDAHLSPVASGGIGKLTNVTCLETLMFSEANRNSAMTKAPFEFSAVVLRRSEGKRTWLKVVYTKGDATSVAVDSIEPALAKWIAQGWVVEWQLHNHPFSLQREYIWVSGYTAPNATDISFYRRWVGHFGLPEARITNGVYTLRLKASELALFP